MKGFSRLDEPPSIPAKAAGTAAPTPAETEAARQIQARARGQRSRRRMRAELARAFSPPDLERAKAHARAMLPRLPNGDLLPLNCPMRCFQARLLAPLRASLPSLGELPPAASLLRQVFGKGLYTYMMWQRMMRDALFISLLFSASNMIYNLSGDGLNGLCNFYSCPTLGNVDEVNTSYAAVEAIVAITFIYWCIAARDMVLNEVEFKEEDSPAADGSDTDASTPADRTVMVYGLPKGSTRFEHYNEFFGEFGRVTHIAMALDARELLLRNTERAKLLEDARVAKAALYLFTQREREKAEADAKPGPGGKAAAATAAAPAAPAKADHSPPPPASKEGSAPLIPPAEEGGVSRDEPPGLLLPLTGRPGFFTLPWSGGERVRKQLEGRAVLAASRLEEFERDSQAMAERQYSCAGVAFISYATPAEARQCITRCNSRRRATMRLFMGARLWAQRAPEPSDIIWENLEVDANERARRQLRSTSITLLISLLGTAVITLIDQVNTIGLVDYNVHCSSSGLLNLICEGLYYLAVALPLILANVILFVTTPILATTIERHHTISGMENTMLLKMAFFQVFNTVVAAFSFLVTDSRLGGAFTREWYTLGGTLIVQVAVGDWLLMLPLLELLRPDGIVNRWRASWAKTQLQMDRLYTLQATYYLSFRAQLSAKFVVLCVMFGTGMPMLYLIGAGYFWAALYIDRYNLLRRVSPPPRTGAHQTLTLTLIVFPFALGMHVMMAYFFFKGIQETDEDDIHYPTSPPSSPPATPSALTTFDTFVSDWSESEATHAMTIIAFIVAGFLGGFYVYNCSRRHGIMLSTLVTQQKQRLIKQVVMQEEVDDLPGLEGFDVGAAGMDGCAAEAYLPPLTGRILVAIGLGPALKTAEEMEAPKPRPKPLPPDA